MKTFTFDGASRRAVEMYAQPIAQHFQDTARIAGVFDVNQTRACLLASLCGNPPVFADFDTMWRGTRSDCVIVTMVDRYHHEFITRSLEAGRNIIIEKPMTIDDAKCRAILAAKRRTGRRVIVMFNYRFQPYVTRTRQLIRDGAIGDVLSVDFDWLLDRSHGADYFRRWHRRTENSGGLLVHESTHHFDAEDEDGYWCDGRVFSDQIDISDTMSVSVSVRYGCSILLSYSLNAHCAYAGWRAAINGTKGRMELLQIESGSGSAAAAMDIVLSYPNGKCVVERVPVSEGEHGGGDERLLQRLFSGEDILDPLGHMAGLRAGVMSILIGSAANQSIARSSVVRISDLLEGV